MKFFNVVHNDGAVQVRIDDDGFATLEIVKIEDSGVLVRAINQTFRAGAQRATFFTGDVANPKEVRKHLMRARTGTTWLNGMVTHLVDGEFGPQFRIDWVEMPSITE